MKFGIFAIKDDLNGFMNLFLEQNSDLAKRGFLHGMSTASTDSLYYSNPTDYALYELGSFDIESGKIEVLPTPNLVVRGERRL